MRRLRTLILALIGPMMLHAYNYDESLLLIYAKIVPKIMALDHTEREGNPKTRGETLCILYEEGDEAWAGKLADLIEASVAEKRGFRSLLMPYEKVDRCKDADAMMLLNTDESRLGRALGYAAKHRLLTFGYDRSTLRDGVMISLYPGKRVYPLVNIEAVKKGGIALDPILFRVARIYRRIGK